MSRKRKLMTSFFDEDIDESIKTDGETESKDNTDNQKKDNKSNSQKDKNKEKTEKQSKDKETDKLKNETNYTPKGNSSDPQQEETNDSALEEKNDISQGSEETEEPNAESNQITPNNDEKEMQKHNLLQDLIEQKKKRDSKKLIGVYFEGDVADVLDEIGESGGRGAKSKIVNDVMRDFFEKQGLL